MADNWETVGETGMKKGIWTTWKYLINGVWKYRLFKGNEGMGIFNNFEEAKKWQSAYEKL